MEQMTTLSVTEIPFQYSEDPINSNEDPFGYIRRRTHEIARLKDLLHLVSSGKSVAEAVQLTRNISERTNFKVYKIAPREQPATNNMVREKQLLQHLYPDYRPQNKAAKQHLMAIRALGFDNFKLAPIDFSYYKPDLPDEDKPSKNARQMSEDGYMDKVPIQSSKRDPFKPKELHS